MPRPVQRLLDMAEHDGGGGTQPEFVRGLHHAEPLVCVHLVGADHLPHVVIENFSGGAGQAIEPRIDQPRQKLAHRQAQRLRAVGDFQRRERMYVDAGCGAFHRTQDIEIGVAGVRRVNAALHAHFSRAA